MPRTLLLDAGNTLVFLDTKAIVDVLAQHGLVVRASTLQQARKTANEHYAKRLHAGWPHDDAWGTYMSRLLHGAALSAEQVRLALPWLRQAHAEFNLWRRVAPGAPAAIARWRASGRPVGVVSNSEGRLNELFVQLGLGDAFDAVLDSSVEGVRKPDPEIFIRAASRLGLKPSDCLYAGDIPEVDIVGAQATGMAAVLIDPEQLYPDYTDAPRCASVVSLIEQYLGATESRP